MIIYERDPLDSPSDGAFEIDLGRLYYSINGRKIRLDQVDEVFEYQSELIRLLVLELVAEKWPIKSERLLELLEKERK